MSQSSCEALAERFASLAANEGLVDVKFYARNVQEAAHEQLCSEVESVYAAYANGEYERLEFNDSNIAKK